MFLANRPNNLLFHWLLEYAADNKFNYVDLGLCSISNSNQGLRRYKAAMGGKAFPITSLEYFPTKEFSSSKEKFNRFLTNLSEEVIQQDLDEKQISAISSKIYRYFA
jgi:hypothetical protein